MFKYSREIYKNLAEKVFKHLMKESGIPEEEFLSFSIKSDNTYNRFKIKITYQDAWLVQPLKARVQIMPACNNTESLIIDITECEGDQCMMPYSIDLSTNDVIDMLTGEVVVKSF